MSSALSLCPSLVQHLAIPSSTSLLMLRLLSEIHSRQLLYASKAFYDIRPQKEQKCSTALILKLEQQVQALNMVLLSLWVENESFLLNMKCLSVLRVSSYEHSEE